MIIFSSSFSTTSFQRPRVSLVLLLLEALSVSRTKKKTTKLMLSFLLPSWTRLRRSRSTLGEAGLTCYRKANFNVAVATVTAVLRDSPRHNSPNHRSHPTSLMRLWSVMIDRHDGVQLCCTGLFAFITSSRLSGPFIDWPDFDRGV